MKLKEFKETYNLAPYELIDFAYVAKSVTDCEKLSFAATEFMYAKEAFEIELERANIEKG